MVSLYYGRGQELASLPRARRHPTSTDIPHGSGDRSMGLLAPPCSAVALVFLYYFDDM
jgi:hypothetical protein